MLVQYPEPYHRDDAMTKLALAFVVSLVVSLGLVGCAAHDLHCDLVNGTWVCSGSAGGSYPPGL